MARIIALFERYIHPAVKEFCDMSTAAKAMKTSNDVPMQAPRRKSGMPNIVSRTVIANQSIRMSVLRLNVLHAPSQR